MSKFITDAPEKTARIDRLKENLFKKMPEIESDRAVLLTESYMATEGEPIITRRAKAFAEICKRLPITIRPLELIVGSNTVHPRGCQVFPEFSFEWLVGGEHATMEIFDKEKKIGYAVKIEPIEYDENGEAVNL